MRVGRLVQVLVPLVFAPLVAAADSSANDPWTHPRRVEPNVVQPPDPNRVPGTTNGTGVIITPPSSFPDAREYPLGMVIRPPVVDPDMVVAPGSIAESLRSFGRGFAVALGAVGQLLQQH